MAQFGEVRLDFITFTTGVAPSEANVTVPVSGLIISPTFSGNVTVTGTLSGATITGTSVNAVYITGQTVSGATITGNGVSAIYVTGQTLSGASITGNSVNALFVTGQTVSGTTITGTNVSANTITGQVISGASITGNAISGASITTATGIFASGTAANPSITFVVDPDTGLFTGAANTLSITVSGTERWRVSGDGSIYTYGSGAIQVPTGTTASRPTTALTGMLRFNTTLIRYEGYKDGDWSEIGGGGGATGSGGDQVFVLNEQVVTTSYTLPSGNNATSCGPITINDGVEVIVGDDQNWAIV
jgi:hypothetical protein